MGKYKKKGECPPNLSQLIGKANSLPHGYSLPSEVAVLAYGSAFVDHRDFPISKRKQMFINAVKLLPNDFIDFHSWINAVITGRTVTLDKSFAKHTNKIYRDAYARREHVLKNNEWIEMEVLGEDDLTTYSPPHQLGIDLAEASGFRESLIEIIQWNNQKDPIKLFGFPPPNPNRFRICINEGVITIDRDPVLNVITEEKIDSRRILECPICKKIVWRKQLTSETCGLKECADILGNQKRLAEAKARKEKLLNHFQPRRQ